MTPESPEEFRRIARETEASLHLMKAGRSPSFTSAGIYAGEYLRETAGPVAMNMANPTGMKVFSGLSISGSKYFSMQAKMNLRTAYVKEHIRDLGRLKKGIDSIKYVEVEEPGVIPRMLARVETILDRFHAEGQPRVETILDSVNGNLEQSQGILGGLNRAIDWTIGLFAGHKTLVTIAIAVAAVAVVVTLVLIPVTLIRIILFGL